MEHVTLPKINLSKHPILNEKWVQERLAENPSLLGIGELVLKDKERMQPKAGRLDLLFEEIETNRRYEVEIQLGRVDESHIIRTIEYWDIERKRYPQLDHCAVIIAEDITSRFLNVISLLNGHIPLIALQMQALQIDDSKVSLIFTKVLNELQIGLIEDGEGIGAKEITDRIYWQQKTSEISLKVIDQMFNLISGKIDFLNLKYNKWYIGIVENGKSNNFVYFYPNKNATVVAQIKISHNEQLDQYIDDAGLIRLTYDTAYKLYKIRVAQADIEDEYKKNVLLQLMQVAHGDKGTEEILSDDRAF